MSVKELIKAALLAILPFIYAALTGKFPDFPLDVEAFTGLVLWVLGLLLGGWQASKFLYLMRGRLSVPVGEGKFAVQASLGLDWKPILKAALAAILPLLYTAIVGWNEAFPLTQADFVALVLFLIGLPLGGWQVAKSVYKAQGRLQ